jgi:ribulose-5-phosphate 4-epimerase/fuculose-1-phosphate aldolase
MRFAEIAYHDYQGVVFNEDEKASLVRDLGPADVMVLRNHGLLACGATIAQAFNSIYRLERICRIQAMAMACNSPIIRPSPEVVALSNQQYAGNKSAVGLPSTPLGEMEWPAMLRILDYHNPGYDQ